MDVRISKYNPVYRDASGAYVRNDEWTSVSDLDTTQPSLRNQYIEIESKYWATVLSIMEALKITSLTLHDFEYWGYDKDPANKTLEAESAKFISQQKLAEGMQVSLPALHPFFQAALREEVWFRALGKNGTFIHFGRDFYLYCGSQSAFEWQALDGIFVEEFRSPYKDA